MKVSSFMPAVTQMIYDMDLQHLLDGITFECPKKALEEKKVVVRCVFENREMTSEEINTEFSKSKATGQSLYYVEEAKLETICPDVVFTQDVCDVCQIDTQSAEAALYKLSKTPEIVPITPNSLEDVFQSALTIAKAMGQETVGQQYVNTLKKRIEIIRNTLATNNYRPKPVLLLEWINPLFNCGHWIPDQIKCAGGIDMLSHPSGDSVVISWEKIVDYDPEILIIAPCGYSIKRTLEDLCFLTEKPEWEMLKAVRNQQVYIADFDMFTQSSASTLVEGIEVLSKIIHPEIFLSHHSISDRYINYFQEK